MIQTRTNIVKENKTDFHEIDVNSLEAQRPRSVSCEHVALATFRFLGLDQKLKELKFTGPQIAAAMGTIIGRMCHPGSELSTHNWLQNKTGLGELIDHDFGKTSLYRMYQVSDMLLKHKKPLEDFLFTKEQSLFELGETITLYDLTNTYFEGNGLYNELAAYGHSKEKRTDCPLVTLGLVLDGSGFPRRSEIFKGNVNEASTMAGMIQGLQDNILSEKPTIVMDAGISGHLFITVLAYHLVHTIRYQLKQSGINISWDNLRQRLTGQNRITISMQCKNGNVIHVRKSTRPEPEQQKLYRVLRLDMHPGKIIKKTLENEQK